VIDAGKRDQLIVIQRGTATADDYGGETQVWAEYAQAWAQVRRGSGEERREAAQESGSQSATFICDWNPTLEQTAVTDRIQYRSDEWDIVDVAPMGNMEIHFTAVRSV
jgi:SPP1 family predicted phage head-tail adaptor